MFDFILADAGLRLLVTIVGIVLGNGCYQAINQLLVKHNKLLLSSRLVCQLDFKGFRITVIERI